MDTLIDAVIEAFRLLLGGGLELYRIIFLSLRVSGLAVVLGSAIGLPVGVLVGAYQFGGRRLIVTLIHTGFALPPVVVGLFTYIILSRQGPFGWLELLFTPTAMVVAQALLAAPYVAGITLAAVQSVPAEVRAQAQAIGANRWQALLTQLREARVGIGAAIVAGFGAVISEVGAVMLVGGNIQGETRVMTTAIMLETRRGNFGVALALGLVLLILAFTVNLLLTRAQQGRLVGGRKGGVNRVWG